MSIFDLDSAFALIEENLHADASFDGEKEERLVLTAEEALRMRFPPSYRLFVLRFGCGNIAGFEIYGIINDDFENSTIPDAIWLTLQQRKTSGLPQELILIAETGEGGFYAINTQCKTYEGDSPIVEWDPGEPQPIESLPLIENDFGDFLLKEISAAIHSWSAD